MIKKHNSAIEIYGRQASHYDYFNRILASFAEIYNYNYSLSALIEEGSLYKKEAPLIRENGLLGRIRAFYNLHYNESEIPIKMYYNEVTYKEKQTNEFGYLTFHQENIELTAASMIALSVRLLEACNVKDIIVELTAKQNFKEELQNNLDCLDIDYQEKEIESDIYDDIIFQIKKQNETKENIVLISGGALSKKAEEISNLTNNIFAFTGTIENLLKITQDSLPLEEKILDIVITYQTKPEMEYALYLCQELRLNGFKTEMIPRTTKEFIKRNYNTKYVIQSLEKNIAKNEVIVTDLYTGEKNVIKEMDLINHLDMQF